MKKSSKAKKAVSSKIKKSAKKAKGSVSPLRLLSDAQMEQLKKLHASGKHTGQELAKKFKVSISTLYNYLNR